MSQAANKPVEVGADQEVTASLRAGEAPVPLEQDVQRIGVPVVEPDDQFVV